MSAATETGVEALEINESLLKCDFLDSHTKRVGDVVVTGYITDDPNAENPCDVADGVGQIFSAHRHSTTHSEMQQALGLDHGWDPDLELAEDHPTVLRRCWREVAADDADFQQWCHDVGRPPAIDDLTAYYRRKADRLWYDSAQRWYRGTEVDDFACYELAREQAWEQLREQGLIGDRDAVSLDVYEHSGVSYSVSGDGMQCPWDTARGGALWVPDNSCRSEIERRAPVYAHGLIRERMAKGQTYYTIHLDDDPERFEGTSMLEWYEAFKLLWKATRGRGQGNRVLGRRRAARELACSAAELYTDYANGAVYCTVVETFEVVDQSSGAVKSLDCEVIGGLYGSRHAEAELKMEFDAEVERLQS